MKYSLLKVLVGPLVLETSSDKSWLDSWCWRLPPTKAGWTVGVEGFFFTQSLGYQHE